MICRRAVPRVSMAWIFTVEQITSDEDDQSIVAPR